MTRAGIATVVGVVALATHASDRVAQATCRCPGRIGLEVTACCAIDRVGEIDSFTFACEEQGTEIRIYTVASAAFDLRLDVTSPEGLVIATGPGPGGLTSAMLEVAGDYSIRVWDDGHDQTGDYHLYVHVPAAPLNPVTLSLEQTVADSLVIPASMNAYAFDGAAGDRLRLWLQKDAFFNDRLEVYAPDGSLFVGPLANNGLETLPPLPLTGVYTVWVYASSPQPVGSYSLYLQDLLSPVAPEPLVLDATAQSSIDAMVTMNAHTFEGVPGTSFRLWVSDVDPGFQPYVEVYSPAGARLLGPDPAGLFDELSIDVAGIHVVWVFDHLGDDTGSYEIYVQDPASPQAPTLLQLEQTVSGTMGTTTMAGYTFDAEGGETMRLWLHDTFNSRLEVREPGGALLAGPMANPGLFMIEALPGPGPYVVWVYGLPPAPSGGYHLYMQQPAAPVAPELLEYEGPQAAAIQTVVTMDAHRFLAYAAATVTITVDEDLPNFQPIFEIWEPGGQLLAGGFTSAATLTALPATGGYTVWLRDAVGSHTGAYEIALECDNGPCDPGACTGDLNFDFYVGPGDLTMLLTVWGAPDAEHADLDGDGTVGVGDLLGLLMAWGPCEP